MTPVAANNEQLPSLSGGLYAFFFDVDGTLAAIQSRPDEAFIPEPVRQTLQSLYTLSNGALALVPGRPIHELDMLAAPLRAPAAGVHGAERRGADGELHRVSLPASMGQELSAALHTAMAKWPGTQLETKGMAFALHYRRAVQYEDEVMQLAYSLVERFPTLALQPGKCVVEIKPQGVDKGAAIQTFMGEAPFAGRIPVFIGDDLTDEKGFLAVNALQGISVKVGEGSSQARYRLKGVNEVHAWLEQIKLQLEQDKTTSVRSQGYESLSGRI